MDRQEPLDHNQAVPPGQAQPPDSAPETGIKRSFSLPPDASQVRLRLEVPEGTCLRVDVEAHTESGKPLGFYSMVFGASPAEAAARPPVYQRPGTTPSSPAGLLARIRSRLGVLPVWLLWAALGLYGFTLLFALPSFPIFFFTDEAVQSVSAADLLRDHLRSPTGELLPTYFQNGSQYNLSTSVYLQALPYFFFGKSIWVTRGTAALVTLLAALAIGLILKRIFKVHDAWLAVMFLSVTPAWFLHARTAFETTLAATFYDVFLYAYLMYRQDRPRCLYLAVVAAALAFYSYTATRMVVMVTALLLLFSDFRYHAKHRWTVYGAVALTAILALPFLRFLVLHPDATRWQMQLLGSYWIMDDLSMREKLSNFAFEYLRGLDPLYWYLPHEQDLPRHTMFGYGHLLRQTIPLGLFGLALAITRIRESAYRTMLIAVLAAPAGAALVHLGITRVLVMVIPMAVLTALGMAAIMDWLHERKKLARPLVSLAVFAILAGINLYMLRDALVNGPLWYSDYSLNGMQYGARQIFKEIDDYLTEHPGTRIILSPSWSNGTDVVARFFFPDPQPFELGSAEGYFDQALTMDEDMLFVMIPEEYNEIPRTRFAEVNVERIVPYPDGRPGFYFVRLKYVDNIGEVIAKEEADRRQMQSRTLELGADEVHATFTPLDMGSLPDLFDGDPNTLVRSWAVNPLQLVFDFPNPRPMQSVTLRIGGTATDISVQVWAAGQDTPVELTQSLPETPRPHDVTLELSNALEVARVKIEVKNANDADDGHVHLWEVTFQ